ncbi:hypothetical protein SAMN06265378_102294 [Paracoccus sediminis]|uniref:Uncharacterized protein n=1 Tax=Paracoccus sediminis TaxID=1214787 RepID=A0A238VL79_9RHOB|nr:hypothetical protein SAMN06265378_102294 [Paracoccus sediminis]
MIQMTRIDPALETRMATADPARRLSEGED